MKKNLSRAADYFSSLFIDLLITLSVYMICCDAFGTYGDHPIYYLVFGILILIPLSIALLMTRGKKQFFIGGGIAVLIAAALRFFIGSWPHSWFIYGIGEYWNSLMAQISRMGYVSLGEISLPGGTNVYGLPLLTLIALSCSVIFALSSGKKFSLVFRVFVPIFFISPLLVFSLPVHITPFLLLCCGLAAAAIRRVTEAYTGESGSVNGILILAVAALLCTAAPIGKNERITDIPIVTEAVSFIREKIGELINGSDPEKDRQSVESAVTGPRSTAMSPRSYTGRKIMKIQTGFSNTLYLSDWYGSVYTGDSWLPASNDYLLDQDFWSDVTEKAVNAAIQKDVQYPLEIQTVTVIPEKGFGNILALPYLTLSFDRRPDDLYMSTDGVIFSDSAVDEPYEVKALVPNGSFSQEFLYDFLPKTTGSNAKRTAARDFYSDTDELHPIINSTAKEILLTRLDGWIEKIEETFAVPLSEIEEQGGIDNFLSAFRSSCSEKLDKGSYYSNVFSYDYGTDEDGRAVVFIHEEYLDFSFGTGSMNKKRAAFAVAAAEAVRGWLADNCSYSLDPRTTAGLDPMTDFLSGAKEGYCVQYATAAALILRELGIQTRYAEGYRASDPEYNDESGLFECTVVDKNAHAWVEIWIDGFGWYPVEVTESGENDTPAVTDVTTEPDIPDPPVTTPGRETDPPVTTDEGSTPPAGGNTVFIIAAAILLVILIFAYVYVCDRRQKTISDALRRGEDGKTVLRTLKALLFVCSVKTKNVLPSEFASDVRDKTGIDAEDVLKAVTAELYGSGAAENDIKNVALFCRKLRKDLPPHSVIRLFIARYVLMRC